MSVANFFIVWLFNFLYLFKSSVFYGKIKLTYLLICLPRLFYIKCIDAIVSASKRKLKTEHYLTVLFGGIHVLWSPFLQEVKLAALSDEKERARTAKQ